MGRCSSIFGRRREANIITMAQAVGPEEPGRLKQASYLADGLDLELRGED